MIIINHLDIPSIDIETISSIDDIKSTQPNSYVWFDYDINIIKYCQNNNINSIVNIINIKEAIFCNALGVKYIITPEDLASTLQNIAENYMFDSKILQKISDDNQIEQIALKGIDGVIYA